MINRVTVSVVIPFYARVDWLFLAVDSVLSQSFTDFELIVINDGSNEDMTAFLEKYERSIIYRYKENGGPASARNIGINLARGEYIAFLDSDDIWLRDKLEKQLEFMEKTDAVWSHTNYKVFQDEKPDISLRDIDISYFRGKVFPICLASSPIATPCVMIKSQYLKNDPDLRFNNEMRYGQDWFLWIHIAMKYPIYALPVYLTMVRLRGENASLRVRVQIKAKAQVWIYMKKNSDRFLGQGKVGRLMRFSYKLTWLGDELLTYTEKNICNDKMLLEFISKLFYLLPYSIFKSVNYFHFRRNKKLLPDTNED